MSNHSQSHEFLAACTRHGTQEDDGTLNYFLVSENHRKLRSDKRAEINCNQELIVRHTRPWTFLNELGKYIINNTKLFSLKRDSKGQVASAHI